jgi:hypothetical protein
MVTVLLIVGAVWFTFAFLFVLALGLSARGARPVESNGGTLVHVPETTQPRSSGAFRLWPKPSAYAV